MRKLHKKIRGKNQMKTQLAEQSDVSCVSEFDPSLKQAKILCDNFSLSFGINSHSDLRSLSLRKSRAH